jgi:xylulokinase
MIGGGANSKLWRQILADICAANIWTTDARTDSVTSLGVALAAGVSAGVYKTLDEAAATVGVAEKTEPLNENTAVYNGLFDKYIRLYPQVKSLY